MPLEPGTTLGSCTVTVKIGKAGMGNVDPTIATYV
jgi:hypothetical protein